MSDWPAPSSLDELVLALVTSDVLLDAPPVPSTANERAALADRIMADAQHGVVVAHPRRLARPRRSRWRPVVVGAALLALSGTAATAGVLLARRAPEPAAPVACRAFARIDAPAVVIASASDPLATCQAAWATGRFADVVGTGSGGVSPSDTIPPLAACVGAGGAVEVFPGGAETCSVLGLAPAIVEPPGSDPITQLQDRLTADTGPVCRSLDEAAAEASQLFVELHLTGWTVVRRPPEHAEDRCARVAVESTTRRVVLVPGPAP